MLSARGGDFGSPPRNFISKPTVKGLASSTTFTTLIVGPIEKNRFDRDFRTAHAEQSPPLRQLLPMKAAEVLVLLEYAMSRASGNHELVCGLSREVLSTADGVDARHDAVFSHLQRRMPVTKKGQEPGPAPKEEKLADATTPAEARRIVLAAVRRKLSTFVAIESDMIDPSIAIEELGLDSLVTFTFRSWIFQNFRADLAAQTISEASSIYALAENIIGCGTSQHSLHYQQRVSLEDGFKNNKSSLVKELDHDADKLGTKSASSSDLPRQPLPALADTVQRFLESAKPFCPRNELEVTNQAVECFVDPQGIGPKLQERLFQREADPRIDNWLSDVYLSRRYLRARTPLVPCQTYFGTHPAGEHPHRQAERAAIVSTAALKFKAVLESGQLEPQFLSGHILDPSSYQWLFNTCREPHPEEDQICTYPQSNYIVVFRRGHAYKVSLLDGAAYDSFETLEAAFESILRLPSEEKSGIGVLTTGGRDSWAEVSSQITCRVTSLILRSFENICIQLRIRMPPLSRISTRLLSLFALTRLNLIAPNSGVRSFCLRMAQTDGTIRRCSSWSARTGSLRPYVNTLYSMVYLSSRFIRTSMKRLQATIAQIRDLQVTLHKRRIILFKNFRFAATQSLMQQLSNAGKHFKNQHKDTVLQVSRLHS